MIRRTVSLTKAATFSIEFPEPSNQGMPTPRGTGFFISPDGWFVTAAHVITTDGKSTGVARSDIDQAALMKEIRMSEGSDGAMFRGIRIVDVLPRLDIALLKVDFEANKNASSLKGKSAFPHLTVSSRVLEEGEPVYAYGYPLPSATATKKPGFTVGTVTYRPRVTSAIVASTIEEIGFVQRGDDPQVYVLDKALNYGNSGGPIVATETGSVHALCSRFQPMSIPQSHLKQPNGAPILIFVPSLYGVVSRLSNPGFLTLLRKHGIAFTDQ